MSIGISVSVRGSIPSLNPTGATTRANRRISRFGIAAARRNAARHKKTGEMEREMRARVIGAEGVEFYDTAPQALFIEEGTPAHVIRPKNAKALRFFGPTGQPVFAREVHHPGTKADPFLEPAIADGAQVWEGIYAIEVEKEWNRG